MDSRRKIRLCLLANLSLLLLVVALSVVFAGTSDYWRVGWHSNLVIVSVAIDSLSRYVCLVVLITCLNWGRVMIEEIGMPILSFTVYNPDKKLITEFSKNELQLCANLMFIVSGVRNVFTVLLTITQIDIALWNVVTAEMATVVTIRLLLNEKTFQPHHPISPYVELSEVAVTM